MKVSIIILSWNRKKDTIETLGSVANLTISDYELEVYELEVVVVDNHSTDGSPEAVEKIFRKLEKKNISCKQIKNKENLGFAAGNNVGMRYVLDAGADYLLALNDDTQVDKDLIMKLLMVAKKHPKAGAIAPKIYFAKGFEFHDRYKKDELGKVFWFAGGDIDWANVYGTNHGVDEVDKGQFNKTRETDFATGACMFLKSEALKEVGLFDEKYFAYLEDADLSQRLKKKGWKVLYTPKTKIWHKVSQSSGVGSDLNDYFITRNRMLFGMYFAPPFI
ncbi:MAG: glycosyltransferase family 2 protein [Patescibacteria group bacterium]